MLTDDQKQVIAMSSGPERSCYPKKKFSNTRSANDAMKRTHSENELTTYPCPFCGAIHIGRYIADGFDTISDIWE